MTSRRDPFDFTTDPTTAPPEPVPRRRPPHRRPPHRRWPLYAGLAAAVAVVGVVVMGVVVPGGVVPDGVGDGGPVPAPDGTGTTPGAGAAPSGGSIVYEVTGEGSAASIEFSAPPSSGGSPQLVDVPLPFRIDVPDSGAASLYTIVARSGGSDGPIACRVVGEETLDERRAEGPFATVTCSAPATP